MHDKHIFYTYIGTPIGKVLLMAQEQQLIGLYIQGHKNFSVLEEHWIHCSDLPLFLTIKLQLDGYFHAKRSVLEIDYIVQGTDLELNVWEALLHIPYGHVISYTAFASSTAYPHAVRAVASAIGRNPLLLLIPCHRVIRSDGGLGGYAAGLLLKEQLLYWEMTNGGCCKTQINAYI